MAYGFVNRMYEWLPDVPWGIYDAARVNGKIDLTYGHILNTSPLVSYMQDQKVLPKVSPNRKLTSALTPNGIEYWVLPLD